MALWTGQERGGESSASAGGFTAVLFLLLLPMPPPALLFARGLASPPLLSLPSFRLIQKKLSFIHSFGAVGRADGTAGTRMNTNGCEVLTVSSVVCRVDRSYMEEWD